MTGILSFALSFLLLASSSTDVTVVTVPAKNDITIPLGANGHIDLKREGTLTHVRIDLDKVRPASIMGPALSVYVVWAVSPEGLIENLGALAVDKDKGRLETNSKFDQIGILITSEPDYMVDRPNSAVAYASQSPKAADIRHVSVPVETGVYDYSKVQLPPQGNVPNLIQQARAAFQVAQISEADHWAESEFRRAKVALDTLEEMMPRGVPTDILAQAADETIRSSQEAALVSRQKAAMAALQTARDEGTVLKQEKLDLTVRVERLTSEETSANAQIQKLQNDLSISQRETQRLTTENEQNLARANKSERELSELKKKQDELQSRLVLQLRDEFFDAKNMVLTLAGREAVSTLSGMAQVISGPVRIQGPAPDPLYDAVRQFLTETGIAPDRIVIVRP